MNSAPRFKLSVLFWAGIGILVVGTGPLILFGIAFSLGFISDPNPNPVGLGLLAFFTFWPGIVITAAGLIVSLCRYRRCDAERNSEAWCAKLIRSLGTKKTDDALLNRPSANTSAPLRREMM